MKQINVLIFLVAIILTSCTATKRVVSVKNVIKTITPELNTAASSELGETVFTKSNIIYKRGAELSEFATFKLMDARVEIKPCKLELTHETSKLLGFKTKNEDDLNWSNMIVKNNNDFGIIYVNKSDLSVKSVSIFINGRPSNKIALKSDQPIFLKEIEIIDISQNNFKQEFIYNGKAGDILKFTYREFVDDMARPAFNQDVQYDLTDSSEIGFKGARFLVINATNMNLEYKVLSEFK